MSKTERTIKIKADRHRPWWSKLMFQSLWWLSLAGLYWVNKAYMDSAVPSWVLLSMFILWWATIAFNLADKAGEFDNADDAKAFVDAFYKTSPDRSTSDE